jgi:hypothetical protein
VSDRNPDTSFRTRGETIVPLSDDSATPDVAGQGKITAIIKVVERGPNVGLGFGGVRPPGECGHDLYITENPLTFAPTSEKARDAPSAPISQNIIRWGSDDHAFKVSGKHDGPFGTVREFHIAKATPAPIISVIERHPYLRSYSLAYNTINGFIYCENMGKVGGLCCAALPINHIFKHLTQTAVRPNSDCLAHAYRIMPSQKEGLERKIQELYPRAPFTPADLQNVLPLPGQVGPIVGIAPPVPGHICKVCSRGYTTIDSALAHWKTHKGVEKPGKGTVLQACFTPVPQMQSLSLHSNFIRYFSITPGTETAEGVTCPLPSSDDMTLLNALQEEAFGVEENAVELDSDAIQEFFRNSGAANHVQGFLPAELLRLVGLPREDEPKLVKLRRAQILRFELHCKSVFQGSSALRRLLVITKP